MTHGINDAEIKVGTWISTKLYGRDMGIVYAIHGEQRPSTIQSACDGMVRKGGNAEFDIVFLSESVSNRLPESILRGAQWKIHDDMPLASREDIEDALHKATMAKVKEELKKIEEKKAFEKTVEDIKKNPEYAHLKQLAEGDCKTSKLAAINIRTELKKGWPEIKFSVRSDYSAVNIYYPKGSVDKETRAAINAVIGKYKTGYYDQLSDCHMTSESPFNKVFGYATYVFLNEDWK